MLFHKMFYMFTASLRVKSQFFSFLFFFFYLPIVSNTDSVRSQVGMTMSCVSLEPHHENIGLGFSEARLFSRGQSPKFTKNSMSGSLTWSHTTAFLSTLTYDIHNIYHLTYNIHNIQKFWVHKNLLFYILQFNYTFYTIIQF